MYLGQRVIHNTTDVSIQVNSWRNLSYVFAYQTSESLYIASEVPFNNLYFDLGVVNLVSASAQVHLWWGNEWTAAVDIIDETALAGASLGQSGRISFSPDRLKGWDIEDDPRGMGVTDLQNFNIYDFYWARFKWSANLTGTTEIKYIGQKFAEDADLYIYYPDLNKTSLKTAFASGKTTWADQIYAATEAIVRDLSARNIVWSRGQILDSSRFVEACCHKAAELIYAALGEAYADNRVLANSMYKNAVNMGRFVIDRMETAKVERDVKIHRQGFATR